MYLESTGTFDTFFLNDTLNADLVPAISPSFHESYFLKSPPAVTCLQHCSIIRRISLRLPQSSLDFRPLSLTPAADAQLPFNDKLHH